MLTMVRRKATIALVSKIKLPSCLLHEHLFANGDCWQHSSISKYVNDLMLLCVFAFASPVEANS